MSSCRKFSGDNLVIATHNKGKLIEIKDLLKDFKIKNILSAGELNLPEPIEDGKSFKKNAEIKALTIAKLTNMPAISDDSGLMVDALNGVPSIYSARLAGANKDFDMAMEIVNDWLGDNPNRSACFVTAMSLAWPPNKNNGENGTYGHVETFEGKVNGTITYPPRGKNGFGYDAIFQANGYNISFGQMEPTIKHAISHRAKAFEKLINNCFN